MYINSRTDLSRMISDRFAVLNTSCYSEEWDDLVEIATSNLLEILRREYDFRYGDKIEPEEIDYFELIREYEI